MSWTPEKNPRVQIMSSVVAYNQLAASTLSFAAVMIYLAALFEKATTTAFAITFILGSVLAWTNQNATVVCALVVATIVASGVLLVGLLVGSRGDDDGEDVHAVCSQTSEMN